MSWVMVLLLCSLAGCSDYGNTRRATYEVALLEYRKACARAQREVDRHRELVREFDRARAGGASTEELSRSLGAQGELVRVGLDTAADVRDREKELLDACRRLRLRECADDESFKGFLETYCNVST